MNAVELVLDARADLGECPRWNEQEGALYWVDIAACALHRLDPATGATRTRIFDQPVACFAFRRTGGFVLGMRDGLGLIDSFDGPLRPVGEPVEADRPWSRFNDGRADAAGRFWAGTMDEGKAHSDAGLWRLSAGGDLARMTDGALTSNGLAFSPDNRTLYWADTPRHVIHAFDLDPERGEIANRRVFHRFPEGQGRPDGGSVDEEGCYWSALYGGARIVRLSPTGEIVHEIAIPARNPTMAAFGGQDRRTLYITTARQGATAQDLALYPNSGGVFTVRVATPGVAEHPFAG